MKKLSTILLFLTVFSLSIKAQTFYLHAEYRNDWYNGAYALQADIVGYPSVTLEAQTQADQFVLENTLGANRWRKFGTAVVNVQAPYVYYPNNPGIGDNYLDDSTTIGHFYTTRFKDLGNSSTNGIVMETSSAPVVISSASQSPLANAVPSNTPVTVTVTLANAKSPEELIFVRFTNNGWSTSTAIPVSFSNSSSTTGTAVIPAQTANTQISYYIMSSTVDVSSFTPTSDYDLVTLRLKNNAGVNYSYTTSALTATAPITFRVNMSQQTVNGSVYLAGTFNSFSTTANPMTQIGTSGVYETTINIDTTLTVQYKFVDGTQFESVPTGCNASDGQGNYNRSLVVPNIASTISTVCFGNCFDCPQPTLVNVTFRVNMSGQTVSTNGVFLVGSFNNFTIGTNPMTLTSAGVYQTSIALDTTSTVTYKFVNGTSFELVPVSCGVLGGFGQYDRQLNVPGIATTLPTVCFGACDNSCAPVVVATAPITFRVNMSTSTVGSGVFLAGSFNAFSATANPMTQIGTTGVYETTVNIDTTLTVQYKFVNGTTYESVSSTCGVNDGFGGFNRNLVVPNSASTLPTVCFASCSNCPAPVLVPVTFKVNMSGTTIGAGGVHIAGTFNAFSRTANAMTQVGTTGVYETTINLDTTAVHYYKFLKDTSNTGWESVPAACGVVYQTVLNREINVPGAATSLPVVCFGACDNSCAPVVVATAPITFRVNMSTSTVGSGVFLAGSFNAFSATANPMTQIGTTGVYETTVNIDTTLTVQYKFVNGTTYESVSSTCGVNDGFGGFNRNLVVPNSASTLPTVCFASCSNCPVPVLVPVTFKVNMAGTTIGAGGVHIAGTFNAFSRTANAMTQVGTTGVYETTINLDTTAIHYYKFLKDTSNTGWESVPAACGVVYQTVLNREINVPGAATSLPVVCFGACNNSCAPVVVATAPITFRVNMSTSTVGSGVFLAGSFNAFSATANPMTQIGTTGVYETTVNIDTTLTVQYKFVNGATYESVSSVCGVNDGFGGFNRNLVVPNSATTLPTVCFASCSNCPVPVLVPVTFKVNMAGTTIGAGGVHIAGTFNAFSRNANGMIQIGTTGVYETTINLDTTAVHYYKFLKDTSNTGWESVPAVCGVVYQTVLNREINVPGVATSLPVVCFNECANCSTVTINNITKNDFKLYPNPASGFIIIENAIGKSISIYDANGRELFTTINTSNKQSINTSTYTKGLYFIKINTNDDVKMLQFIIE